MTTGRVLVATALMVLLAGCTRDSGSSSVGRSASSSTTIPASLEVAQRSNALPASRVETGAQVVSEITGQPSGQSGSQVGASQVSQAESNLAQLGATRTDQGVVVTVPEKVLFDFDKSDVKAEARPILEKVAQLIAYYAKARPVVRGFTDDKGSDDYNQTLSERRAEAVKSYLVSNLGVDGGRLSTEGAGEKSPVAPNTRPDGSDNPEGRAQNRRVEVLFPNA
ncbi:MAG: OmpA family protein [Actinomycetota bacterium]|nr:OmpA family protein [Actinomycetota bacterium]